MLNDVNSRTVRRGCEHAQLGATYMRFSTALCRQVGATAKFVSA